MFLQALLAQRCVSVATQPTLAAVCEVSNVHFGFVQVSNKSRDLQILPPAADESEVLGYIFRFLSRLSILAPELGLGEIATVLSHAVLGSLGKDLMSDITCVWKQTGMTCLLVDHEAQNATAVSVVDIMVVENSCRVGLFLCNQAASDRCVCADFEYIGSGSNRNFCFTDLLLRERRNTDIAHE